MKLPEIKSSTIILIILLATSVSMFLKLYGVVNSELISIDTKSIESTILFVSFFIVKTIEDMK